VNTYTNLSRELKTWFNGNSLFRALLPADKIIMYVALAITFLHYILGIDFGGFLINLVYWVFIVGLLLTYANNKDRHLYIGLFSYTAICVILLIISLFKGAFNWYYFFNAVVFGWFGYVALRNEGNHSASDSFIYYE